MAFQIWRLFSGASKFFYRKWLGRRKTINGFVLVGYSLEEFVPLIKKTKQIKQNTERCFVVENLVSRNEPRELENIDARDLDVLIVNFLLQVRKKDGGQY